MALIRRATADDAARIGAVARAAYGKYIPRIGREPAPMVVDFAAEIAAGHVVVIGAADAVDGYMIAWPETHAYFIDNIAVDPARQGERLDHLAARNGGRRAFPDTRGSAPSHFEAGPSYVRSGGKQTQLGHWVFGRV